MINVCVTFAGGMTYVLRVWGPKADVAVQSVHLSFGVGALLAAQVARPWLQYRSDAAVANHSNSSLPIEPSLPQTGIGAHDAIEYPYAIIAGFTLLVAVPFAVLQTASPIADETTPAKSTSLRGMLSPNSWLADNKSKPHGVAIVVFVCAFAAHVIGAERMMARFLYVFSVESRLQFAPKLAATLETVFWASFTASRVVTTAAARWIPAATLLTTAVILHVMSTVVLLIYGEIHAEVMWMSCVAFAVSLAALMPTMTSWANSYIDMGGIVTSLIFISSAIGSFIFTWSAGYFFQFVGPSTLLYLLLVTALTTAITFVVTTVSALKYGHRSTEKTDVVCEVKTCKMIVTHQVTSETVTS